MEAKLPDAIGGFKIERELGQGGMGKVYVARQESLDRLVALKVLLPKFAEDAEFLARFQRESKAAALFQHPNVVAVIDAGKTPPAGSSSSPSSSWRGAPWRICSRSAGSSPRR